MNQQIPFSIIHKPLHVLKYFSLIHTGKPTLTLDAARLSGDPPHSSMGAIEVTPGGGGAGGGTAIQCVQRGQAPSLTLPLNRYHGSTITSAATVHHSQLHTPTNQQQHIMNVTNHHFEDVTPTDGVGGRLTLSPFSSGNANFSATNNHQVY